MPPGRCDPEGPRDVSGNDQGQGAQALPMGHISLTLPGGWGDSGDAVCAPGRLSGAPDLGEKPGRLQLGAHTCCPPSRSSGRHGLCVGAGGSRHARVCARVLCGHSQTRQCPSSPWLWDATPGCREDSEPLHVQDVGAAGDQVTRTLSFPRAPRGSPRATHEGLRCPSPSPDPYSLVAQHAGRCPDVQISLCPLLGAACVMYGRPGSRQPPHRTRVSPVGSREGPTCNRTR